MLRKILPIIIALFFMVPFTASAQQGIFKITDMGGKVLVKGEAGEWADAKAGQPLSIKDSIKTGDDGNVLLELPDKTSIALKPNTEISIDEISWDSSLRKANINMEFGKLRVIIKKVGAPSEFKVKTPTAVCGARACIFYTDSMATGTKLSVTEDSVDLISNRSGKSVAVVSGMTAFASSGGAITGPTALTDDEKRLIGAGWAGGLIAEAYSPTGNSSPAAVEPPEAVQEGVASKT